MKQDSKTTGTAGINQYQNDTSPNSSPKQPMSGKQWFGILNKPDTLQH
jgi:hypothetical protein